MKGQNANGDVRTWRVGQKVNRRTSNGMWVEDTIRMCFSVPIILEPYERNVTLTGAVLKGVPWSLTTDLMEIL